MSDPKEYSQINNVTEDECFDRWEGVKWTPYEGSDRGVCDSDYDFDGWVQQHEGDDEDE